MGAGRYRHRVEIQALIATTSASGATSEDWATTAITWASIEPLQGRELIAAQQVQSETTHRIKMRYRTGVTGSNRIKFGDRVFELDAAINVGERNRELALTGKEIAA